MDMEEKMKNKKSVSPLVATLLLILITVASIGIIWGIIWGIIMPKLEEIKSEIKSEGYKAMNLCFNETAEKYCNSINMSFKWAIWYEYDNVFADRFACVNIDKHITNNREEVFWFIDEEKEKCRNLFKTK